MWYGLNWWDSIWYYDSDYMIPNQKTPKLEASTSIDMEQLEPLGSSFVACDHPRARNRSSNHCHKALRVPQVCQWGMGTRNPMIYHHVSTSYGNLGISSPNVYPFLEIPIAPIDYSPGSNLISSPSDYPSHSNLHHPSHSQRPSATLKW